MNIKPTNLKFSKDKTKPDNPILYCKSRLPSYFKRSKRLCPLIISPCPPLKALGLTTTDYLVKAWGNYSIEYIQSINGISIDFKLSKFGIYVCRINDTKLGQIIGDIPKHIRWNRLFSINPDVEYPTKAILKYNKPNIIDITSSNASQTPYNGIATNNNNIYVYDLTDANAIYTYSFTDSTGVTASTNIRTDTVPTNNMNISTDMDISIPSYHITWKKTGFKDYLGTSDSKIFKHFMDEVSPFYMSYFDEKETYFTFWTNEKLVNDIKLNGIILKLNNLKMMIAEDNKYRYSALLSNVEFKLILKK